MEQPPQKLSHKVPEARLSPAEWEIMCLLWKIGKPFTVESIHKETCKIRKRDHYTINTLLKRMERKGWVAFDREVKRPYPGRVLIHPQPAIARKVKEFLHQDLAADPEALAEVQRQLDTLRAAKREEATESADPR